MDQSEREQLEQKYKELVDRYGDELPVAIHYPRQFKYFVNMYLWHKELEKIGVDSKKIEVV